MPTKWLLTRVRETHPGKDNIVCVVQVRIFRWILHVSCVKNSLSSSIQTLNFFSPYMYSTCYFTYPVVCQVLNTQLVLARGMFTLRSFTLFMLLWFDLFANAQKVVKSFWERSQICNCSLNLLGWGGFNNIPCTCCVQCTCVAYVPCMHGVYSI